MVVPFSGALANENGPRAGRIRSHTAYSETFGRSGAGLKALSFIPFDKVDFFRAAAQSNFALIRSSSSAAPPMQRA